MISASSQLEAAKAGAKYFKVAKYTLRIVKRDRGLWIVPEEGASEGRGSEVQVLKILIASINSRIVVVRAKKAPGQRGRKHETAMIEKDVLDGCFVPQVKKGKKKKTKA